MEVKTDVVWMIAGMTACVRKNLPVGAPGSYHAGGLMDNWATALAAEAPISP